MRTLKLQQAAIFCPVHTMDVRYISLDSYAGDLTAMECSPIPKPLVACEATKRTVNLCQCTAVFCVMHVRKINPGQQPVKQTETHLQFLTILTDTKTKDAPSSIEEASKVLRQKLREEKKRW